MKAKLRYLPTSHRYKVSAGLFGFRGSMIGQKYTPGRVRSGLHCQCTKPKIISELPCLLGRLSKFADDIEQLGTAYTWDKYSALVLQLQISWHSFSRWYRVTTIYCSDQCCLFIAFCSFTGMSSPPVASFLVLGTCLREQSCRVWSAFSRS